MAKPNNDVPGIAEISVGRRLRELRAEQDLSIRALAEKSGLNANTLSLIENSKHFTDREHPPATGWSARGTITAFFETDAPKNNIAFQKAGQRPTVAFANGMMEDLGAGLTSRGAEPFIVTLEPNADSGPNPIVDTGREFVYCMEGRLAYTIEERNLYSGTRRQPAL